MISGLYTLICYLNYIVCSENNEKTRLIAGSSTSENSNANSVPTDNSGAFFLLQSIPNLIQNYQELPDNSQGSGKQKLNSTCKGQFSCRNKSYGGCNQPDCSRNKAHTIKRERNRKNDSLHELFTNETVNTPNSMIGLENYFKRQDEGTKGTGNNQDGSDLKK